jgi:hypothetical protein
MTIMLYTIGWKQLDPTQSTHSPIISFSLDNWLVSILTCCGYLFSLSLDGNKYFMGSNGCNPYTT